MKGTNIAEEDRKRVLEIIEVVQEANAMQTDSIRKSMDELRKSIEETAHRTRSIHRILIGEPEIKRKGLVEMVDKHENIVVRGGATFCAAWLIWEVVKATVLKV